MVTTRNTIENLDEGEILLQRMQDLEAYVETPQVTTIVKKCNMAGTSKKHENEDKALEDF